MRAARFTVAAELLAQVLDMPPDSVIVDVHLVDGGAVEFTATHPALPEADDPHPCDPILTLHGGGPAAHWDWNLG